MGSWLSRLQEQRAKRLAKEMYWRTKTCREIIHPFSDSCYTSFFIVWKDAFGYSSKIYGTLFLFGALFTLSKKQKKPLPVLYKALISTIKSSDNAAFLSTMGASTLPISCFLRHVAGQFRPTLVYLAGVIAGFIAILIESKSRRRELTIFTAMNVGPEALYRMFMVRNWLPSFDYGDVYVSIATMATLSFLYNRERQNLGNIRTILQLVLGDKAQVERPPDAGIGENEDDGQTVPLCTHRGTCVFNTTKGFLRGIAIGLIVKGGFSLVVNLFWKRLYRNPAELLKQTFGSATRNFALFLAFFISSWKGVNCLVKNLRGKDDGLNSGIAGAVSGLSVVFSRSTEMSMFLFSKAIEGIWNSAVARGMVKPVNHGDVILFSLWTGFMFYCATLEPYNLRPSYWRFLQTVSGYRFSQFEPLARAYKPEHFERIPFQYPYGR